MEEHQTEGKKTRYSWGRGQKGLTGLGDLACYLEASRLSDTPLLLSAPLGQMPFPGGPVAVGDLSQLTQDLGFVL